MTDLKLTLLGITILIIGIYMAITLGSLGGAIRLILSLLLGGTIAVIGWLLILMGLLK
jgi:hypothetical protein